jgi:hypothetical protein
VTGKQGCLVNVEGIDTILLDKSLDRPANIVLIMSNVDTDAKNSQMTYVRMKI